MKALLQELKRDEGSVSPLVITFFLISLLIVFIGINVTHTYLERRYLILTLEASLQRAAQEIDDYRYYTGYVDANTSSFGERGVTTFVPIDCVSARQVFDKEFRIQWALTRVNNLPDRTFFDYGRSDMARNSWYQSSTEGSTEGSSVGYPSSGINSGSSRRSAQGGTPDYEEPPSRPTGITSILHPPRVTAFQCDGKTLRAEAELVVELPFVISFAGVDFKRYSKQSESVEVGLVLGG